MTDPYELHHGDLWYRVTKPSALSSGLRHVCDAHGEMAVAFEGDQLLKIGNAEDVSRWVSLNAHKVIESDPEERGVQIVRFPVSEQTVAELNALSVNRNRVSRLIETLTAIGINHPEHCKMVTYPK